MHSSGRPDDPSSTLYKLRKKTIDIWADFPYIVSGESLFPAVAGRGEDYCGGHYWLPLFLLPGMLSA